MRWITWEQFDLNILMVNVECLRLAAIRKMHPWNVMLIGFHYLNLLPTFYLAPNFSKHTFLSLEIDDRVFHFLGRMTTALSLLAVAICYNKITDGKKVINIELGTDAQVLAGCNMKLRDLAWIWQIHNSKTESQLLNL